MAKALVVFESMYGNTAAIASAVAEGLSDVMEVSQEEVGTAAMDVAGVDLLVVGGPTHGRGMTNPDSRRAAGDRTDTDLVSTGIGIREWMATLEPAGAIKAATFDTRMRGPRSLWGSAARKADDVLQERGFELIAAPESFLVNCPTRPLEDALLAGELERARSWGAELALLFQPSLTSN